MTDLDFPSFIRVSDLQNTWLCFEQSIYYERAEELLPRLILSLQDDL